VKKATFDTPPPGAGLTTVTAAVFTVAMSAAGTLAVNWESFTNVVASGLPFQFTVESVPNPVPFTVRVNPLPPGATASGTSGWLIRGTGLGEAGFCYPLSPTGTPNRASDIITTLSTQNVDLITHLLHPPALISPLISIFLALKRTHVAAARVFLVRARGTALIGL